MGHLQDPLDDEPDSVPDHEHAGWGGNPQGRIDEDAVAA